MGKSGEGVQTWVWSLAVVSGVWVLLVVLVPASCGIQDGWWCVSLAMQPWHWGDYLAGLVAPLALLWFVLAYFQQASELRQQRRELELQRAETTALVQQAKKQAEAAEAQVEHLEEQTNLLRRKSWPQFDIDSKATEPLEKGKYRMIAITNRSAPAFRLHAVEGDGCEIHGRPQRYESGNDRGPTGTLLPGGIVRVKILRTSDEEYPARFTLQCRTEMGDAVEAWVYLEGSRGGLRCEPPQLSKKGGKEDPRD